MYIIIFIVFILMCVWFSRTAYANQIKDIASYTKVVTTKDPETGQETTEKRIICPNCQSEDLNVQVVQTGSVTTTRDTTPVYKAGRKIANASTLGLNNLVTGEKKYTNATQNVNRPMAVCQKCGKTWGVMHNPSWPLAIANGIGASLLIALVIFVIVMIFWIWL